MADDMNLQEMIEFERYKDSFIVDTNHCQNYVNRKITAGKDIILTVHLPYESLKHWHTIRRKYAEVNSQRTCSYSDILTAFLSKRTGFSIKPENKRIEKRLDRICGLVRGKFVGKNGSQYRKLCQQKAKLGLELCDLVKPTEIQNELLNEKHNSANLEREKNLLQQRYGNIFESLIKAQNTAEDTSTENFMELEQLKSENKILHDYTRKNAQVDHA